jgi:cell division protein FtsZ
MAQAERGIAELMESVDTTIVIPNEKLLAVAENAGFFESFRVADDILRQGVQGISDIITIPGIINRDFADVKAIMASMGYAVMGTATASGNHRTTDAAQKAIASPLLEAGAIDGARGILINITGSSSLKLAEVQQACTIIQGAAHDDANIIFGAVLDEKMKDSVKITVIATGFREVPSNRRRQEEVRTSFAASHNEHMDFHQPPPPDPVPTPSPRFDPDPLPVPERIMKEEAPMQQPAMSVGLAEVQPDAASIDVVRSSMATNFEQDNLDVPAFLRKRGDIM